MWRDPNLLQAVGGLSRKGRVADLLAVSTGGRRDSFFQQGTMERVVREIGEELHAQYLLSFTPAANANPGFHPLRVEVRSRPDARVRSRAGYWLLP